MAGARLTGRGRIPAYRGLPSHQRGRVSSKADDFDVRYRDVRDGPGWDDGSDDGYAVTRNHPPGTVDVLGGTVDYDLGYGATGWDTQGFRSPEAGYLDSKDTGRADPASGRRNGRVLRGLRTG